MSRCLAGFAAAIVCCCVWTSTALADGWGPSGSPGAAGMGDRYFPIDGNGGYDVKHYRLDLAL